jgi:2-keto-4-pentenoate hydratase
VSVAAEIIDSRIADWRIKLPDTIADNASYGGFVIGPWSTALKDSDLRTVGMLTHQTGFRVAEGVGAAALGHPAEAVAWLANKLSGFGVSLEEGDVVLSGALAKAVPVSRDDTFLLEAHGQPLLKLEFG